MLQLVNAVPLFDGHANCLEIEDLALGPMEHIHEGVLHHVGSLHQLLFDVLVIRVVQHELRSIHVHICREVDLLVDVPHASQVLVVVDRELLGRKELG